MTGKPYLAAVTLLGGLVACGGGGGSTPTTPTNPTPNVNACGAIAQTVSGLTAITNGSNCSAENTSVVSLTMRSGGITEGSCTGTVIGRREILTAAHCLDSGITTVLVWRGEVPPQQITASSFKRHPSYNAGASVTALDVGVVFVDQDLGRPIVPLLLSRQGQVGETAIVAGWGRDLQSVTAFLRAGTTTLSGVDPSVLRTQFSATSTGVCSGDSGGPLLLSQDGTWAIAGIISATSESTCNTGDHFYAAVLNNDIQSFIRDNVPELTRR